MARELHPTSFGNRDTEYEDIGFTEYAIRGRVFVQLLNKS